MDFEKFVEKFPKAKFVKLPKFKEEELVDEEIRRASKVPIGGRGIQHAMNVGEARNWITDGGRIGFVVPNKYMVVDVDNKEHPKSAATLEKILYQKGVKFWSNQTKQGVHFFFKSTAEVLKGNKLGNSSGLLTTLGIQIDTRSEGKGYVALPVNDPNRDWKDWSSDDIDELPVYVRPLRKRKPDDYIFIDMPEGNGSTALMSIRGTACGTNMMTSDESIECLRIINELIWSKPMSEEALIATVARDKTDYDNIDSADGTGKKEKKEEYLRILAQRLIEKENLIAKGSTIYKYADGQYRPFLPQELDYFILTKGDINLKQTHRKEVCSFICAFAQKDGREFNKDYATIAVQNGMLDLNNMEVLPHTAENINTIKLKWNYNPEVEFSETINNFMKQVSMYNERKERFLWEAIGYCLLKKNIFSKFFIFKGGGGTGKSTLCNLIKMMVGDEYVANVKLSQFDQDYYLATLSDKLVNIDYDASEKKVLEDSGRFKSIVVSEPVMVRQIYETPITLTSCATIIVNTNHIPKISDKTDGMRRRIVLVSLDNKIPKEKMDADFLKKITTLDMEYFLVKAVEGLQRVLRRGGFDYDSEKDLDQKFTIGQSNVKKWLFEKQIDIAYLKGKTISEMFTEFRQFCQERNYGLTTMNTFKEDVIDETDLLLWYDNGAREEVFDKYDNDPRPDDEIFIKRQNNPRISPKWQ